MTATGLTRRQFTGYGAVAGAAVLPAILPAQASAALGRSAPSAFVAETDPSESTTDRMQGLLGNFVDMRFGMFLHYSLGTYSNEEWALPNQSPTLFAPTSVDCAQWAAAAKAAKMEYAVLTTKHHDGFSLWPTAFGTQNVAHSGYRQDVVRNYVDAFRAEGLRIGFYFSIWDRTAPIQAYGGHVADTTKHIEPENLDLILGQLTELLTDYGPIDLLMTDGYTWQMGMQSVSYRRVQELVKELQPDCLLTDICAVTQPWLGDAIFWEEPLGITVPEGNIYGGMQGQTISNGWFWHPSVPTEALMSVGDILEHLNELEPRYTSFLLNCPPNRNGRLDANVVQRLAEVGAAWPGPDTARPPLPAQPVKVEWPVVPVAAYATAYRVGEGPFHAIDGRADRDFETCWSTWPGTGALALPAALIVDLGGTWSEVSTLQYLPKQWRRSGTTDGDITHARVYVSTDGFEYEHVATGVWGQNPSPKTVEWAPRDVAYVKFEVLAGSGDYSNVNGIKVGGRNARPQRKDHPLTDQQIRVTNPGTGAALTAAAGAASARTADESASQVWVVREAEDNYWYLESLDSSTVLTLTGTNRNSGAAVALAPQERTFRQQWAISALENGTYRLTNRFNMLTLGPTPGDVATGVPVTLRPSSTSDTTLAWTVSEAMDPTFEDVSFTATTRCVASKVTLVVRVQNGSVLPVNVSVSTDFGDKTFTLLPGKTALHAFSTRQATIGAGTARANLSTQVEGSHITARLEAAYTAASCG